MGRQKPITAIFRQEDRYITGKLLSRAVTGTNKHSSFQLLEKIWRTPTQAWENVQTPHRRGVSVQTHNHLAVRSDLRSECGVI